jgi:hypothetical protein
MTTVVERNARPHRSAQRQLKAVGACRCLGQCAVAIVTIRKLRIATQSLTRVR